MADEPGHLRGGRPEVDVGRGRHLEEPARRHHGDLVGQRQRLALVVGDQHGRRSARAKRPGHGATGVLAQTGVEGGEGLVEEHERRIRREGPRERDALLLPARQLVGEARRDRGRELDEVEDLAYAGPSLMSDRVTARQAEADVGGHVEMGEERTLLGDVAHATQTGGHRSTLARDDALADRDGARVGVEESGDQPQQRRLAAARGPEHRGDAVGDVEVQRDQDRGRPERLGQPLHAQAAHRVPARTARA